MLRTADIFQFPNLKGEETEFQETAFATTQLLNPKFKFISPNSQTSPLLYIYLALKKYWLIARHFFKHFTNINPFNPHFIDEKTQFKPKWYPLITAPVCPSA